MELRQACLGLPNLQRIAAKYPRDRDSKIGAHARESSMSKQVTSYVLAVFVGLIILGSNRAALAADDCLAGPNRSPAPGGHWYYHRDRASDRKCWYLVEPAARTPTADAMQPQPAPEPSPQPGFGSFFSSLSAGFPGSANGTQPVAPAPDARSPQAAPADDLRYADTAPARDLRPARRPAAVAALPKPHQPTHPRPPAEPADEHAAAPPDQAERDALFQEYLRWRERQ
jgi:hypothetical protein